MKTNSIFLKIKFHITLMKGHHLSKPLKVNQSFKDVGAQVVPPEGERKVCLMHWELGHLHTKGWQCGRLGFSFPELQISDEGSL